MQLLELQTLQGEFVLSLYKHGHFFLVYYVC